MLRLFHITCLSFLLLVLLSSCKDRNQDLLDNVNSLIGKPLSMPSNLIVFNDSDNQGRSLIHSTDYRIIIYLDPFTCSVCKVKEMRLWDERVEHFLKRGIPTIILVDTDDILGYKKEVDLQKVKPLFAYDIEGKFMSQNCV